MYFRYSCLLKHFEREKDWKTREMIEVSRAVKCPSIDLQLAGIKYF